MTATPDSAPAALGGLPAPSDRIEPLTAGDPRGLGPYRLLGRLGAGGMGRVYLGQAPDGALTAVKMVHEGFAHDERFRARFVREVAIARRVTGSWAAAVLDANPQAARPWMATEYVAGPTLEQAIEADTLSSPALPALCRRLAAALAALHAQSLVHRDLKPSNVILGAEGARLIDFGIARAVDATTITHTGAVVGPPRFMSPEQANGLEAGPASDVFSLAGVLVFALTGHPPFGDAGAPPVVLLRILTQEPHLDEIASRLRTVLRPCLHKDPASRPSAAQLAEALAGLADDNFAPDTVEPDPAQTQQSKQRRWLLTGAASAVALTVVLMLALVSITTPDMAEAPTTTTTAPVGVPPLQGPRPTHTVTVGEAAEHVAIDPNGRAYVGFADGVRVVEPGASTPGLVIDLRSAPHDLALDNVQNALYAAMSDFPGGHLQAVDTQTLRPTWSIPTPGQARAVVVDTSRSLAYVAYEGTTGTRPGLLMVDTRTETAVGTVPLPVDPSSVAVGGDGSTVTVSSTDGGAVVVDPGRRRVIATTPTKPGAPAVLKTRTGLDRTYELLSSSVEVFDSRTSRHRGQFRVPRISPYGYPTFLVPASTGHHLFLIMSNSEVLVLDAATTFPVARFALPPSAPSSARSAVVSSDGQTLFVTDEDNGLLHAIDVAEFAW